MGSFVLLTAIWTRILVTTTEKYKPASPKSPRNQIYSLPNSPLLHWNTILLTSFPFVTLLFCAPSLCCWARRASSFAPRPPRPAMIRVVSRPKLLSWKQQCSNRTGVVYTVQLTTYHNSYLHEIHRIVTNEVLVIEECQCSHVKYGWTAAN